MKNRRNGKDIHKQKSVTQLTPCFVCFRDKNVILRVRRAETNIKLTALNKLRTRGNKKKKAIKMNSIEDFHKYLQQFRIKKGQPYTHTSISKIGGPSGLSLNIPNEKLDLGCSGVDFGSK